jgi:SAM-dependent methyltransferase
MKFLIRLLMKPMFANYVANQLSRPNGFFGSRFIGKMMNKGNADLEQLSLTCSEISATDHVLEIGFGNGQLLQQLCTSITTGKVYGVDISTDLITQVGNRFKHQIQQNKLELHLSGVSQLPMADNSIDTIITNNTIYFWPNPLNDAKELLRVLKPGGKLIIGYRTVDDMERMPFVTQNLDIFKNRYTDADAKQLLIDAGFLNITISIEANELATSRVAVAQK